MKDITKQVKKVCGFYVNDWHLTTMILPYIHKELEKENEIITILQKGIKSNIDEILEKMNLKENLNNKIKQIDWTSTYPVKYTKIKSKIKQANPKSDIINILINGNTDFIEIVNSNIIRIIQNTNLENKINIINCYNVTEFTNVSEITTNYEYILNTTGIKKTDEVFKINNEKNA